MSRNNPNGHSLTTTTQASSPLTHELQSGNLTRAQREVIRRANTQRLITQLTKAKIALAAEAINQIHGIGGLAYNDALGTIFAIKEADGRSPEHQHYVDAFADEQLPQAHNNFLRLIRSGNEQVMTEVENPLHQDEYPETLWERWRG